MKILVTGATGNVGGHVARRLAEQGRDVRALVRDPVTADLPAGVEVVQGDLTDPDAVRRALQGVDRAFLNMADDNGAVFAAVAGQAGLGHVVLLSSFTAVVELPSGPGNVITARHRSGEQALTAAGVPATFLRAAGFDVNIGMWLASADGGVVRTPFPDVALPVVDPADIAAVAVAVLTAEDPQPAAHLITGPDKVSVRQQVQVLNELLGRTLTVQEGTVEQAGAGFPAGTPDIVVTSVLETMGPAAAGLEPTDDVRLLTGVGARTFTQWAREHTQLLA